MKTNAHTSKHRSKLYRAKWVILSFLLAYQANLSFARQSDLDILIRDHLSDARAQGYPTSMKELYKLYKRPPAGKNAADLYLQAFEHFPKHSKRTEQEKETERLLPYFGDVEVIAGEYMDQKTLERIWQYLRVNRDALALLHRAASRTQCRYPIESEDNSLSMSHFGGIRHSVNLLNLESMYYTNRQQLNLAIRSLRSSFALANSLKNEPLLISWLVYTACAAFNISVLNDILNLPNSLSKENLIVLADAVSRVDYDSAFQRAMIGEYAHAIDQLLIHLNKKEQLLYLEFLQDFHKIIKLPLPDRVRIAEQKHDPNFFFKFNENMCESAMQSIRYSIIIFAKHEATRRLAVTSLAVEQYRCDRHKLPDSLNELVPEYLKAVPSDPYDGKDLRYKKLKKGYVVYSIGRDRKDNNGTMENADGISGVPGTDIAFTVAR